MNDENNDQSCGTEKTKEYGKYKTHITLYKLSVIRIVHKVHITSTPRAGVIKI